MGIKELDKSSMNLIVDFLRPNYEHYVSHRDRVNNIEKEIKKYTAEQYKILDLISEIPHVYVHGSAGTGKTFIAIEAARRKFISGKKVLFIIYNSEIKEFLKKELYFAKNIGIFSMHEIYKNITRCNLCGSLKSNLEGCTNCENTKEKFNKICVVEDLADQWSIENSNIFKGYFHILGGTISSAGQRKEDLLINSLVERVNKDNIEEVILATSATVEGQTTAYYIQDSLKNSNVKVTKLAQGLPVGGEIESLDDGTLFSAFKNRSNLNSNSD